MSTYYWARIFKYNKKFDGVGKGTLLEEEYYKDIHLELIKDKYKELYGADLKFRRPVSTGGIYAIIMPSNVTFYNRGQEVHSYCINCEKELHGRLQDFNLIDISSPDAPNSYVDYNSPDLTDPSKTGVCCSYDCKTRYMKKSNFHENFNYQEKEPLSIEGRLAGGFIYEIYNRADDTYYVGKTKYSPFFRWHEHFKSNKKGDIHDLSFRVLTVVASVSELGSAEAWWVHQYKDSGKNVVNSVQPAFERTDWESMYVERVTALNKEIEKNPELGRELIALPKPIKEEKEDIPVTRTKKKTTQRKSTTKTSTSKKTVTKKATTKKTAPKKASTRKTTVTKTDTKITTKVTTPKKPTAAKAARTPENTTKAVTRKKPTINRK